MERDDAGRRLGQCLARHQHSWCCWSRGGQAGARCRGEQREGSQYLLGVEVRDPSLGAERDVSLHAVGHFMKLSDDEKDEAGEVVSSETGLRALE